MRIKLDENLPASVASALTALAHEVHTVAEENLSGSKDHEVWEAAQQESLFLITQDLDFCDTRKFAPGTHSGMLLVRLHSPHRTSLIQGIKQVFLQEEVALWSGCFGVVSEHQLRVVRRVQ
jgi:predicted nuclease of predicted toxin-antitoxin system